MQVLLEHVRHLAENKVQGVHIDVVLLKKYPDIHMQLIPLGVNFCVELQKVQMLGSAQQENPFTVRAHEW